MRSGKSKVGLIGLGTVGKSVVKLWPRADGIILKRIVDKDKKKGDSALFSTKPDDILNDPEIDIVIELIGGINDAYRYIKSAIEKGKNVVTANKALLALKGEELEKLALAKGVSLGYEASVCAGIPIIRGIREGLAANRIRSIYGIINGTANFILSAMEEEGIGFARALSEAQEQGFAESNPTLDIDGLDSQHKLAILARLSFKTSVKLSDIYVEGIRRITHSDITYARELGYSIKLLAIAKAEGKRLDARVHPTLISKDNLLSSVRGIHNACFLEGDACGKMVFYGQGAGGLPTASAILSDVKAIASEKRGLFQMSSSGKVLEECLTGGSSRIGIVPIDELFTRYYVRFSAIDKPGVLARICDILGKHNISIVSVIQKERSGTRGVPIVMMTHKARESSMRKAISSIDRLNVVKEKSLFIRVEEVED
ncbi:MAG: homoserine dehydrogenase [Candidatus Omnitrophica bacterium]|nr:homoserine dehydrogenase [Candidatus Omnitrophota bacterium]